MLLLSSGSIGFVTDQSQGMLDLREFLGPFFWFVLAGVLFFYLNRVFNRTFWYIVPALLWLILLSAVAPSIPALADHVGYTGWLVWCTLIVFLIKVEHPPVYIEHPLVGKRRVLAVVSFIIFILCFSIQPIAVV